MRISEAANNLDVHPNTLIQYEEIGLLEPDRNSKNNYRNYDEADIEWVRCLQNMIHEESYSRKSLARMLELNECWEIMDCSTEAMNACLWAKKIQTDS